ncbi:MAG TPA: DUF3160 domain-containing protein [Actinomycetota bacterium]|nr:DUF3160 domain-containing protein [Actinomycetota bacterium]
MKARISISLLVFVMIVTACTGRSATTGTGPPSTSASSGASPAPNAVPISLFGFGSLPVVPLLGESPVYAGPATPHSLASVRIARSLLPQLTPEVRALLTRYGFAIVPSDTKLMYDAYTDAPYGNYPVFVTTDVAYHQWHLTFDKVLRSTEQEVLLPKLEALSQGALVGAQRQAAALRGTPLATEAARVAELFQAEVALLGLPAGALDPQVRHELALIRAHTQMAISPILGNGGGSSCLGMTPPPPGCIDYSLFTPRGHYTTSAALTRYFLGMSLLGQSAFRVTGGDLRPFAMGVLASRVIVPSGAGTAELAQLWRDLYQPTAFLVGAADDYTPFETAAAVEATRPGAMRTPQVLTTQQLRAARAALLARRSVMVDPEAASIRLMGTRFVIDAYILDQLVDPSVKDRLMPSGMDLAAAFGSRFAYQVQRKAGQTAFVGYDSQMGQMRHLIATRPQAAWGRTVYDGWLWAIQPSWLPHGAAFPDFMRTRAWTVKSHQTGLGSYAELRHDTILYVKQSSGEGEGPSPDLSYRSWVEPDPVVYERLSAVTGLMLGGLGSRGLLTAEQRGLLTDTRALMDFFARIAKDELAGKPIAMDDDRRLEWIGDELEALWFRSSDHPTANIPSATDDDAVIADIARGGDQALEIGTGRFDRIIVLVPDNRGTFELAVGGVYSYYEFGQPVSNRLTDEAWRQMLDQNTAPARPSWETPILSG